MSSELEERTCDAVRSAVRDRIPLRIAGAGTKKFFGRQIDCPPLELSSHRGIVDYQPSELTVTVRAGTPLTELEDALGEHGQMLPFEPPHFGPGATVGGALATGLSGPRRAYAGSARDLILGCRIVNGQGEAMSFGGTVMKNVAGYDVSRLMVGAQGTLGVILEASLKVLPAPESELSRVLECTPSEAIETMNRWASQPLPISATCYFDGRLFVRLSGSPAGLEHALNNLGGDVLEGVTFWSDVKEHKLPFLADASSVWRISVPPATPPLTVDGETLMEWNGGLRWLVTDVPSQTVRELAQRAGGHAIHFKGHDGDDVFHPLDPPLLRLHQRLKHAFDPYAVLNPERMYTHPSTTQSATS